MSRVMRVNWMVAESFDRRTGINRKIQAVDYRGYQGCR